MGLYSVRGYGAMIADSARQQAYRAALEKCVGEDSVVLDIGTGSGAHALLAASLGARRVYAVESEEIIQLARRIAADNALTDRIEFIQGESTRITLPEPADVIVSDLRGIVPLFGDHLPSIRDARNRHLAGGGTLVPISDTIWIAPVEAATFYEEITGPWEVDGSGLDLSAARAMATQAVYSQRLRPAQIVAQPAAWASIDYRSFDQDDFAGSCSFELTHDATVHGVAAWFTSRLIEGVELSTAPADHDPVYGRAFFPLTEALPLEAGDRLGVEVAADLVGGDYVWRWRTEATRAAGGEPTRFDQSTFHGLPLSSRTLALAGESSTPALNADGRIDAAVLGMLDAATPLRSIAERIARRFPDRFESAAAALERVARLARRYGE